MLRIKLGWNWLSSSWHMGGVFAGIISRIIYYAWFEVIWESRNSACFTKFFGELFLRLQKQWYTCQANCIPNIKYCIFLVGKFKFWRIVSDQTCSTHIKKLIQKLPRVRSNMSTAVVGFQSQCFSFINFGTATQCPL